MEDFGSREARARTPTKGLRLRLRTRLRELGVVGKFRTDELRSGTLVVMSSVEMTIPLQEFEGRPVRVVLRPKSEQAPEISEFQQKMVSLLERFPNSSASTTELAARLKSSRLAVVSAGKALARKGRVCSFRRGDGQWSVLTWALCG
jgi:hypothetical protein